MRGPFENRYFRRLFAGRVITNVGDSFYFVAAMWLVYDLTGNPFYSGLAGFLTLAPSAFQFLAGPLVDRWPIARTLTATQLIQAVVVLAVPVAAFYGLLSVWVILLVMPALAALNQLVYPAQTAALPRLLDDEDLVAANSAFSVAYQGVEMVANAAGGLLIALVGGVALFALDAVTFGVAALLFATVVIPPASPGGGGDTQTDDAPSAGGRNDDADPGRDTSPVDEAVGGDDLAADGGSESTGDEVEPDPDDTRTDDDPASYVDELREGAGVLRGTFLVWLVAGAAVLNLAGGMALAVMPSYADTLSTAGLPEALGASGAYGILMAAFGAGNLLGALGANLVDDQPFGRLMVVGFTLSAVFWGAAVAVDWLPVTAGLLVVAFVPSGVVNVQLSAVVQTAVPDRLVGRVSSVLGSLSASAIPFGSLAGGVVASTTGPQLGMWVGAAAFGFLAVYSLSIPSLRRLPVAEEIELDSVPA